MKSTFVLGFMLGVVMMSFVMVCTSVVLKDYDCDDFPNMQGLSQFLYNLSPRDIYGLDRDRDGVACDTNK